MLTLSGKVISTTLSAANGTDHRRLFSLSTNPDLPAPLRPIKAYLQKDTRRELPRGFAHYLIFEDSTSRALPEDHTLLGAEFSYLGDGDVIALGEGRLRSLFRANSDHNSLLLTERCNHYCLMCSQPPRRVNDDWILDEAFEAVRLIPQSARSIGLTGGEPTLYGARFIELVRHFKHRLPQTALHILSNGRAFVDRSFAAEYAKVQHPDAMLGIPIYASDPSRHDYVVQAVGAFDETVRGVLHLKELGQQVEIRVVLHKQTTGGLVDLARFIARNLLFVDHVALMGLEMTGFTRANLPALWIDPLEYQDELSAAVQVLRRSGVRVSVYNLPLCLVHPSIEPHYIKSISDWKNEFPSECRPCRRKSDCGGFFSSALQHGYSKSIKPFEA